MTHNSAFLFPHPISSVKSIVLKIVSLPCTLAVAVITPFPSILINRTLFSSEPGNALILSQTSPRSTLRARLFQWRTTSGYSASHSIIACRWTSTSTKSVARAFTTYVHWDIFDQPSPSAIPTCLPAQSSARGSTTPTPCCTAHNPRTLIVFNGSKIRWLDASLTQNLIEIYTYYLTYSINWWNNIIASILNVSFRGRFLVAVLLVEMEFVCQQSTLRSRRTGEQCTSGRWYSIRSTWAEYRPTHIRQRRRSQYGYRWRHPNTDISIRWSVSEKRHHSQKCITIPCSR